MLCYELTHQYPCDIASALNVPLLCTQGSHAWTNLRIASYNQKVFFESGFKMLIVTDRLSFLQLNRGSLSAIQKVGGTSLRRISMSKPQPPGLKTTFQSSIIAFCDPQHEWVGKNRSIWSMPARLQLSLSLLARQLSSLFEEAIYPMRLFVCLFWVVNLAKGEKCMSPYFLRLLS